MANIEDPTIIGRNGKMVVIAPREAVNKAVAAKQGLPDETKVQYWNSGLEKWSNPMEIGVMARFVFFEPAKGELAQEGLVYP